MKWIYDIFPFLSFLCFSEIPPDVADLSLPAFLIIDDTIWDCY